MEERDRKSIKIDQVGHLFLSGQNRRSRKADREDQPGKTAPAPTGNPCVVALCAAKDDVGRSIFSVNLAMELARQHRKTSILPQLSIGPNVITLLELDELEASPNGNGIRIIEGPFGISIFLTERDPDLPQKHFKSGTIKALEGHVAGSSFLLIEIPNTFTKKDDQLLKIADEAIVLVPPDPEAMIDSFKQLQAIFEASPELPIWIIAHGVDTIHEGEKIFREMEDISVEFLGKHLEYMGSIYKDPRYFLTCLEDPSAILRGRFSRTRKCIHEVVNLLCMTDDIFLKTSNPRLSLSRRS